MKITIPATATQGGILVASIVFTIVSKTGQASTFLLEKGTDLAALALGASVELIAGPVAGTVSQKMAEAATANYLVPAARTGTFATAAVASAVAGAATTLLLAVSIEGGKYVVRKIGERSAKADRGTEIAYEIQEGTEDFLIVLPIGEDDGVCETFTDKDWI